MKSSVYISTGYKLTATSSSRLLSTCRFSCSCFTLSCRTSPGVWMKQFLKNDSWFVNRKLKKKCEWGGNLHEKKQKGLALTVYFFQQNFKERKGQKDKGWQSPCTHRYIVVSEVQLNNWAFSDTESVTFNVSKWEKFQRGVLRGNSVPLDVELNVVNCRAQVN